MDNYIGEIRAFPYDRIPGADGWVPCEGQILTVMQNQALFALLGYVYGGNGTTTFALPDLRGRAILGTGTSSVFGSNYPIGTKGGVESVTLAPTQIPPHTHNVMAMNENGGFLLNNAAPTEMLAKPLINNVPGLTFNAYRDTLPNTMLNPASVESTGGSVSHENRVPLLALKMCICTKGVFPPRE